MGIILNPDASLGLAAADVGAIPTTTKGAANGVATLGADGKVPAGQLPAPTGGGVTLAQVTTEIGKNIASTVGTTNQPPAALVPTSLAIGANSIAGDGDIYNSLNKDNTALGNGALARYSSTVIGTGARNIGGYDTAIGNESVSRDNGVAVGSKADAAIQSVAIGRSSKANSYSMALGYTATSGTYGVSVGRNAYTTNSWCAILGDAAISNGQGNCLIGKDSRSDGMYSVAVGMSTYVTSDNCSAIGYQATVTGANQVQLGNSSTTTYTYGAVQNRSDARDKTDIQDCDLGLDFINALQPKKWLWDYREDYLDDFFPLPDQPMPAALPENATEEDYQEAAQAYQQDFVDWQTECQAVRDQRTAWMTSPVKDGSKTRQRYHFGVIAQQVKIALDALSVDWGGYQDHSVNGGQPVESIGYSELIAPLIKAVQELSARVQQLEQQS